MILDPSAFNGPSRVGMLAEHLCYHGISLRIKYKWHTRLSEIAINNTFPCAFRVKWLANITDNLLMEIQRIREFSKYILLCTYDSLYTLHPAATEYTGKFIHPTAVKEVAKLKTSATIFPWKRRGILTVDYSGWILAVDETSIYCWKWLTFPVSAEVHVWIHASAHIQRNEVQSITTSLAPKIWMWF